MVSLPTCVCLQAAAVRAQLEAQLDAKATELSAAQRQLAALQQQLLAQRSAGSKSAAAEVEQLRRQLAMERERRQDAERAAAYAGQVMLIALGLEWSAWSAKRWCAAAQYPLTCRLGYAVLGPALIGPSVRLRLACTPSTAAGLQAFLLRCAAALPAALPSCSIDPVQSCSCSHALQAVDAEAAALEEQASLLREQVDLLKAQLGRKDSELTQQAQQLAQQAQQLQVARREAATADERMQQLKQAVVAEAVAAAEVLDKAEQAAQLLGQQLLAMMQSRQEGDSDWEEEEEEEEVTLRTAQVRYRAGLLYIPLCSRIETHFCLAQVLSQLYLEGCALMCAPAGRACLG